MNPDPERGSGRLLLRSDVLVPGAVATVFLVLGAVQLARVWHPDGDWAVAELIIRHVGRRLPLSGPYSADRGYDHPLPLVYALQLPGYFLSGQRSSAGLATTVWFNGAVLTGLTWLLVRRRATGLAIAIVAAVSLFAAHAYPGTMLLPWNPNLGLVPAVALVFVAWRVAEGSRRLLPVLAALAVWCAGAHLGFVPMVLAIVVPSVALLIVGERRDHRAELRSRLGRPVLLSAAVTIVLLSPMLVDVLLHGGASNPFDILRGGTGSGSERIGAGELLSVFLDQLRIPPSWATSTASHGTFLSPRSTPWPTALPFIALILLAARRRGATAEIRAVLLGFLGMTGAILGLANIDQPYLVYWYLLPVHAGSVALWAGLVWSGGRSVLWWLDRHRTTEPRPAVRPMSPISTALAAGASILASLSLAPSLRVQSQTAPIAEATADLAEAVAGELPAGSRLTVAGPIRYDGYLTPALVLELDRAGFDVRVPDDALYLYSETMARPQGWRAPLLEVVLLTEDAEADPDAGRLIARRGFHHPLIPTETVELRLRDTAAEATD